MGQSGYPSLMPSDASKMYSNNIISFLRLLVNGGDSVVINLDDVIIGKTCLTHNGSIVSTRIKLQKDDVD